MGFDAKKFKRERFTPRTAEVPVPDLAEWFGDGEPAVWGVRGLTGQEVARAREVATRGAQNQAALLEAFSKRVPAEAVEAIRAWAGEGGKPAAMTLKIEYLLIGSVSPDLSGDSGMEVALKLLEAFPAVFEFLTGKIIELTGLGSEPGKSKPSGGTTN